MLRLAVVTFGFLGWAWYELSGGADFEPGTNSLRVLAKVETEELPPAVSAVEVAGTQAAPILKGSDVVTESAPQVTRSTNSGVELAKVSAASFPAQSRIVTVVPHPGRIKTPETVVPVVSNSAVVQGDTLVGTSTTSVEPVVEIDYRRVTGNRVNLRAGPGTSFGVVDTLRRGDEVEVLQDPGTGWVKLRSFEGNSIGWMSGQFLQVASN